MAGIADFRQSGQYQTCTLSTTPTGGTTEAFATVLTTRGKLRMASSSKSNNAGELQFNNAWTWTCRFQTALVVSKTARWFIDGKYFSIVGYELTDQINEFYTFRLLEVE